MLCVVRCANILVEVDFVVFTVLSTAMATQLQQLVGHIKGPPRARRLQPRGGAAANAVRPPLPTAPPRAVGRQECSCPPEVPPAPNSDALAAALEGPFYDLEKYVQPRKAKWTHHCPRLGLFLTSSQNEYFC